MDVAEIGHCLRDRVPIFTDKVGLAASNLAELMVAKRNQLG